MCYDIYYKNVRRICIIHVKTSYKKYIVIIIALAVSVAALIYVLFGLTENAVSDDETAYTAVEPEASSPAEEEPAPGLVIYDQRVETIEIDQSQYFGTDRETVDIDQPDNFIAGKVTAFTVTFKDPIDDIFSEGIPLCYISVYNEGEFITQIAASGLYDGHDLYFQPKYISEAGYWAEGFYTFELYLGDGETAAAVLTADFVYREEATESPTDISGSDESDNTENDTAKPPEIISMQDEITAVSLGEEIRFEAEIYDEEDGRLSGGEVMWTLDGKIYLTGSTLWVWPFELPPGTHTFTCTATNSEGLSSEKDFVFNITEYGSDLPDDWANNEIAEALSKGLILPLTRLWVPVSRGQYANLMADFYDALSDTDETDPSDPEESFKYFGRDDRNRSLMVSLGVMELQDGFFEPNKPLSEEEAALIMSRIIALTIPDYFGANDETGIMDALDSYGLFDGFGIEVYQPREKLTQKLALIRASRLYDTVIANELRVIAKGFDLYQCDDAAEAMRAALIKRGKQGAIIDLYFSSSSDVFIHDSIAGTKNISSTGIHVGVLFNGRVYCNVFPGGLPEAEWLESFFEASGSPPYIEYLPF